MANRILGSDHETSKMSEGGFTGTKKKMLFGRKKKVDPNDSRSSNTKKSNIFGNSGGRMKPMTMRRALYKINFRNNVPTEPVLLDPSNFV